MVKLYNDFLSVSSRDAAPPDPGAGQVSMAGTDADPASGTGGYVESDRFKFRSASDANVVVRVSKPGSDGHAEVKIGVYYV